MDAVYESVWDVVLLEYAVAMHTKHGELSRKKRALERIGVLEVNGNNNSEILRLPGGRRRVSQEHSALVLVNEQNTRKNRHYHFALTYFPYRIFAFFDSP